MSMERQIQVLIATDNGLFGEGLRLILAQYDGIDISGFATTLQETLAAVAATRPDVVVLDMLMQRLADAARLASDIARASPNTKALLIAPSLDERTAVLALKAGGKGCLSRDATGPELARAIQALDQGELWLERKLFTSFLQREVLAPHGEKPERENSKGGLTERESEVLRLLGSGRTNKEIARSLYISEKTVKSHLNSIFRKLNVTRRVQAALYANGMPPG